MNRHGAGGGVGGCWLPGNPLAQPHPWGRLFGKCRHGIEQMIPLSARFYYAKKKPRSHPVLGTARGAVGSISPGSPSRGAGAAAVAEPVAQTHEWEQWCCAPGIKAALSGAGKGVPQPGGVHPSGAGGSPCCAPHKGPGSGLSVSPGGICCAQEWGVGQGGTGQPLVNTSGLRHHDPGGDPAPGSAAAGSPAAGRTGQGWEKLLVNRLSSIILMQL